MAHRHILPQPNSNQTGLLSHRSVVVHDRPMSSPSLPRPPSLGQPAPRFILPATDGGTVDLASCPKPALLVFLRHLA